MNGKAKWVQVSWMAAALLPLVAGFAGAANLNPPAPQTNQPTQQDRSMATMPEQNPQFQPKLEKAKDLIGAKVFNDKGEQLGTIADVVLTPDLGGVNYVVLSHGWTWGAGGEKYFAVPWSKLSLQTGENGKTCVIQGVSKADLDQAPGFDKNHWPVTASDNWLAAPGSAAVPERMAPGATAMRTPDIDRLRLSKLIGMTVRDLQNENLGRLDNAMIDINQGKLAYGIVGIRHGFLGLDKDFVAVPWSALDWTSQPGIAKLDASRDTLMALAFSRDNFPNLEDPQYSRQLFERFHVTPYWEGPSQGQNLGFIPGEENPAVNPPSSDMTAPNSSYEKTTPDSANSAVPGTMIAYSDERPLAYNPNTVATIHGRVTGVGTYRIEGTSERGVLLHVKADDGKTRAVQVAPRFYLDRQGISFHRGDLVTITGSVVRTAGHREALVASQIQMANRTLDLRTPAGQPLWSFEQFRGPSGRAYSYRY